MRRAILALALCLIGADEPTTTYVSPHIQRQAQYRASVKATADRRHRRATALKKRDEALQRAEFEAQYRALGSLYLELLRRCTLSRSRYIR